MEQHENVKPQKAFEPGLVSIYTPTYNSKKLIRDVYASVAEQTYTNWEWVICDDGSRQDTREVLEELRDSDNRIKLYYFDNCGNIGKMKKRCTERCNGEFLIELDHDDKLTDDCVEEVVKAFQNNPDAGMAYSNFTEVTDDHEFHTYDAPYWQYRDTEYKGKVYKEALHPDIYGSEYTLPMNNIRYWELMPNHVRAFRASELFRIGGYDDTLIYADDYDVIARMYLYSKIVHIPKLLYIYRWGENTWTSDKNADLQQKMAMVRDKYFPETRLHLGCGAFKAVGFQGVDNAPYPGVDHVINFTRDGLIKFPESSIDHIHALDYIQKFADKHHTLKHIFRVLKHDGIAYLQVPSTDGRGAFQDPDHKSFWNENAFLPQYMNKRGKYHFAVDSIVTTPHDNLGICWVQVQLRAIKSQ